MTWPQLSSQYVVTEDAEREVGGVSGIEECGIC